MVANPGAPPAERKQRQIFCLSRGQADIALGLSVACALQGTVDPSVEIRPGHLAAPAGSTRGGSGGNVKWTHTTTAARTGARRHMSRLTSLAVSLTASPPRSISLPAPSIVLQPINPAIDNSTISVMSIFISVSTCYRLNEVSPTPGPTPGKVRGAHRAPIGRERRLPPRASAPL